MFLFQLQKQEVKRDDTSGKISQDNAFIKDVAESSYEKPHTYWSVAGLNSLSTKKAQENAELAVSMMQEMGALKSDWKAADGLNDNELKLFKFIFKMLITRDLGRESAKYTRDFFSDGNGKLLKGTCEDILKEVWDSDTKGSGLVDNDDSIG